MKTTAGLRLVAGLFILFLGGLVAAQPRLTLQSDTALATAGYYQLRWDETPGGVVLVESDTPTFQHRDVVYAGHDTARLVSGKPDGKYFYRLEAGAGATGQTSGVVSNTLEVSVQHHPLQRAFLFFCIGAAVFAATLGLVLFGGRAAGKNNQ